jgi:hypothetical protein
MDPYLAVSVEVVEVVTGPLGHFAEARTGRVFELSRADSEVVQRVADRLAAAGVRVWIEKMLHAGTNWLQEIERELSAADFVALFISPHSVGSGWAKQELQVALHQQVSGEGGAVIPVILADVDVPPLLRQFQRIDLRGSDIEKGVGQLVDAIRH